MNDWLHGFGCREHIFIHGSVNFSDYIRVCLSRYKLMILGDSQIVVKVRLKLMNYFSKNCSFSQRPNFYFCVVIFLNPNKWGLSCLTRLDLHSCCPRKGHSLSLLKRLYNSKFYCEDAGVLILCHVNMKHCAFPCP